MYLLFTLVETFKNPDWDVYLQFLRVTNQDILKFLIMPLSVI